MAVVVTIGIGNIQRADLPAQSGKIAAAVRYLYNLSVINNQSYRLVIDLESNEYWGEELPAETPCDVFLVESEGEKGPNMRTTQTGKKKKGKGRDEEEPVDRGASFQQAKDNLLTKRKLENKIEFRGVVTAHSPDRQTEGQVQINFFPSGYVEKAYIYLGYGDETYTIETRSLLGTAEIHREEMNASQLFKNES